MANFPPFVSTSDGTATYDPIADGKYVLDTDIPGGPSTYFKVTPGAALPNNRIGFAVTFNHTYAETDLPDSQVVVNLNVQMRRADGAVTDTSREARRIIHRLHEFLQTARITDIGLGKY